MSGHLTQGELQAHVYGATPSDHIEGCVECRRQAERFHEEREILTGCFERESMPTAAPLPRLRWSDRVLPLAAAAGLFCAVTLLIVWPRRAPEEIPVDTNRRDRIADADYFPLVDGAEWTYRPEVEGRLMGSPEDGCDFTLRAYESSPSPDGRAQFWLSDTLGSASLTFRLMVRVDGIHMYDNRTERDRVILPFPVRKRPPISSGGVIAEVVALDEEVEVPAGKFRCTHVRNHYAKNDDEDFWFAPRIGLMRWTNRKGDLGHGLQGIRWEIVSWKIERSKEVRVRETWNADTYPGGTARHGRVIDADTWKKLWSQIGHDRPIPEVDFSKEMVLAVLPGEWVDYMYEVVDVREFGDRLQLRYRAGDRWFEELKLADRPYGILAVVPRSRKKVEILEVPVEPGAPVLRAALDPK